MNLSELNHKLEQWAAEYVSIGGAQVPPGFLKFVASRLQESGSIADDKDIVTIYRDGKSEKVRILSQSGPIVSFRDSTDKICTCTITQMKMWCKGHDLARAVDHVCFGENSEYEKAASILAARMGSSGGTGALPIDSIGKD